MVEEKKTDQRLPGVEVGVFYKGFEEIRRAMNMFYHLIEV